MATLLAHVTVKPGMEDHWEDLARKVFAATHANEPACRRYEYWRGSDERTYYVMLSFDDFDGFMVHQVADYHHDAGFSECFESLRLEWVDPIQGAAPLPPSETVATRDPDKSDLWNRYVTNHSADPPAWWSRQRS